MAEILHIPGMNSLCFYICLLAIKLLAMSAFTSYNRKKKLAIPNTNDLKTAKILNKIDAKVERIRRAHLNDLENIIVFMVICAIYLSTNPPVHLAVTLIRVYTIMRMLHTLVYVVFVIPQPTRFVVFIIGYLITAYMTVETISYYMQFF